MKRTDTLVAALLALTALGGTAGLAETSGIEDPMAEAKAFLASPTSLSQAIATAESAAGGKAAAGPTPCTKLGRLLLSAAGGLGAATACALLPRGNAASACCAQPL